MIAKQKQNSKEIKFTLKSEISERPAVPHVWDESVIRKNVKLGVVGLEISE
jgi:hypothetical protein